MTRSFKAGEKEMEMKVNGHLIRSHRERRAWSQEHLAQASGLGLRTIQRIEASGLASYDSIRAIASVLEISVLQLTVHTSVRSRLEIPFVKRLSILTVSAIVVGTGLFASGVLAKDVMLNVGLEHNGKQISNPRLLTSEGKEAEIRVDGVMRLIITPTIQPNGNVLLTAKIYESKGTNFVLISEPKLATKDNEQAEIRLTSDGGNSFRVRITPAVR
jgi:transcriptional regulator with XRE-family HTH domain